MSKYLEQFERVKRFLRRIENQDRDSTEYDDDLWAFFQNCYHLKDWLSHDSAVGGTFGKDGKDIDDYINGNIELAICADLANRTKHLELNLDPTRWSQIDESQR